MKPPEKDQTMIGLDEPTLDASNSPANKDTARQEFKQEADINYMLSRFGITSPRGAPTYGEVDETIDLQTAIESVREARDGYQRLDKELRDKFPSMEAMLNAVENGSLVLKHEEAPEPVKTPLEVIQERLAATEQELARARAASS